jgi:nucleoside-diphosphate-sugar epimerase
VQFYSVAKTLAEQAAIEYGSNSEMDVVTICPSCVAGPCLTSTFPESCQMISGIVTDLGI